MRRPSVTLTKRQVQSLLTLPEEAEIGRKEQRGIISAALKVAGMSFLDSRRFAEY